MNLLKIFWSGLVISFVGSLPFGILNITAFQIAAAQGIQEGFIYAIAVVLVELIAVRIAMFGTTKKGFNSKILSYALPFGIILLTYFSISSFTASQTIHVVGSSPHILQWIKSSFLLGLVLSALNPMHIPFWLGWNSILLSNKTLGPGLQMFSVYLMSVALGSLGVLIIYILAGNFIFSSYNLYISIFSTVIGFLYLILAVYLSILFYKIRTNKKLVRNV